MRPHRRSHPLAFVGTALALCAGNFAIARWVGATAPVPEWPVAVDLLWLLPLPYLWLMRPTGHQALLDVAAVVSAGVLAGAFIIPAADQHAWLWLSRLRWVGLGGLLLLQAMRIARVTAQLWRARGAANLEEAVHGAIARHLGQGTATRLVQIDARLWLYLLCRRPRLAWRGPAFGCARHEGNASHQRGFLWLLAAEIPIAQGLVHLLASPPWAWGITMVSLYGLAFLYAEYRATLLRPTTLEAAHLHVRHGLLGDLAVPYAAIARVAAVRVRPPRAPDSLRFVGTGRANLTLHLRLGTRLPTLMGEREIATVHLGVDAPAALRAALMARSGLG